MRVLIALTALFIYGVSMNLYIFYIGMMPTRYSKLWYNYTTLFAILFIFIEQHFGVINFVHKQINLILKSAFVINILLFIAVNNLWINDESCTDKLLLFNGAIFATSLLIIISALRHGFFTQSYCKDAE